MPISNVISDFGGNATKREASHAFGSRLNIAALIVCIGSSGCAFSRQNVTPATNRGQQGVVFVVDGAGNFQATSEAVQKAVEDECLPLTVIPVEWSHGYGRVVADHTDWPHSQEMGCRLAGQIASYRQSCPGATIYLLAHSAGSAVALTAAGAVPPDSIDRIILLAPSVSTDFDLRPALRNSREGIDVFYSRRDVFSLGLCVGIVGTADGCRECRAAGRFGFRAQAVTPEDALLYAKLRQHPWERCVLWTGNLGGHSGTKHPRFLHTYVLPLMDASRNGSVSESTVYSTSADASDLGP